MPNFRAQRLQAVAGTPQASVFNDDFNRANTTYGYGVNYMLVVTEDDNAAFTINQNILSNQIRFGNIGGSNFVWHCVAIPIPLMHPNVKNTLRQFSQLQLITDTSAGATFTRCGIGVYCGWENPGGGAGENGDFNGYFLHLAREAAGGSELLLRRASPGQVILATFGTVANNDTLRLNAIKTPTTIELEVFQNGVSIQTFSDNAVGRPANGGYPGISCAGGHNGIVSTWDNLSCGIF